ncbi:MAG TPA: mannose-1-phosphate guanylyltransferase/mannose-6-phosphate isomerase [Burkholderiales bacterium]|nr:mannose-1-phosphate guanylyltransferase/mannose-6-phosphate isomerase [Burkholderiales bacterium]
MPKLHPVVLCGGSGTRLWPMSRRLYPKQFLALVSERSMLQDTVQRLAALPEAGAPVIVSNNEHRFLVAEHVRELELRPAIQILEPVGRNTAPAVAVAALHVSRSDPDGILLVVPSDSAIQDRAAFGAAATQAVHAAAQGYLVTFGIRPTFAATGYGYVEPGEPLPEAPGASRLVRFIEKPNASKAEELLASGRYLWNSGMFAFSARKFLDELRRSRPDILAASETAFAAAARDLDFLRLDEKAFSACPAQSVDYAVMEKTSAGAVVPADMGWSDVGSWSALWDIGDKDAAGNVTRGDAHVRETSGSYVRADSRLVYVLGLQDVLVVETADAVLVSDRGRAEEVKEVVEQLESIKRSEHVSHTRVYRPWGHYESLDTGARFQVKRLTVKPGQAISLQLHRKRAEHWVVVSGKARVTRGDEVVEIGENQSTYIPIGTRHRLENPGTVPLEIIEVQSGSYLGEDDIERFDDRYGRG